MVKRIGGMRRKTRYKFRKEKRQKGKISITRYFQSFNAGDRVYLGLESAVQKGAYYPRFMGRTGIIKGKRGNSKMGDMQIISETPINIYYLKKELEKVKKRDSELNFRANRTEEYLNQAASNKNMDGLFDKMMKLNIPRLKEQHIHKIIDITPTTLNDLKVILQSYTVTVNNESMKKIVDTINEFLEK